MNEKRTRKTGYHKPRALSAQIQRCHDVSCNMIEHDTKKPSINLPKPKKKTRWSSGFCKLCGEHMECVTHLHAESHGYKSAEEFIEAGNYAFD
jgi:hypothetical protein